MILTDTNSINWKADWQPIPTRPKDIRHMLNAVIRHGFKGGSGYVGELVTRIHALALIVDDPAVVSTCGRYVARPAMQAAVMAVEIDMVVTDKSPEYLRAEAWADAIKRYNESRPIEYA